ncbi:uncharacterized protein BDW70DRAFT_38343 [Aspergillus foveolatus]|uniref:uncharacterized protein n=1 Tax=Aspergillus foveolatus TaxID=210207 RepID=UPI003CCD96DA
MGNEFPRLEKSLLGQAEASLEGRFPKLREVRWDKNQELHQRHAVRTTFASTGVEFDYEDWSVTESTLSDGGQSPLPNFWNLNMMLDMEDPDL